MDNYEKKQRDKQKNDDIISLFFLKIVLIQIIK